MVVHEAHFLSVSDQSADAALEGGNQIVRIRAQHVGRHGAFQVAPQAFDQVQAGTIGRQPVDRDLRAMLGRPGSYRLCGVEPAVVADRIDLLADVLFHEDRQKQQEFRAALRGRHGVGRPPGFVVHAAVHDLLLVFSRSRRFGLLADGGPASASGPDGAGFPSRPGRSTRRCRLRGPPAFFSLLLPPTRLLVFRFVPFAFHGVLGTLEGKSFFAEEAPQPIVAEADSLLLNQIGIEPGHGPNAEAVPEFGRRGLHGAPQGRAILGRGARASARGFAWHESGQPLLAASFANVVTVAGQHPDSFAIEVLDRPTPDIEIKAALRNTATSIVENRGESSASHSFSVNRRLVPVAGPPANPPPPRDAPCARLSSARTFAPG